MRRISLETLIVVPNASAAIVAALVYNWYPGQLFSIVTFLGVVYIGYGALAAPWITGYLEDKKTHTEVLRSLFFGQFEAFSLGGVGVSPMLDVLQLRDDYVFHVPMSVMARYSTGDVLKPSPLSTELVQLPIYSSALSHLRAYPKFYAKWSELLGAVGEYNRQRPDVLNVLAEYIRADISKEYPGLEEGHSRVQPLPVGPFFDVGNILAIVYLYAEIENGSFLTLNLQLRDLSIQGVKDSEGEVLTRTGVGPNANCQLIVSQSQKDRDPGRLLGAIRKVAREPDVIARVRQLMELEKSAWTILRSVESEFADLDTRLKLGDRIKGTCDEVGY